MNKKASFFLSGMIFSAVMVLGGETVEGQFNGKIPANRGAPTFTPTSATCADPCVYSNMQDKINEVFRVYEAARRAKAKDIDSSEIEDLENRIDAYRADLEDSRLTGNQEKEKEAEQHIAELQKKLTAAQDNYNKQLDQKVQSEKQAYENAENVATQYRAAHGIKDKMQFLGHARLCKSKGFCTTPTPTNSRGATAATN